MEHVLVSYFKVESEAFQALSDMKQLAVIEKEVILSHVGIFKREAGRIQLKDSFDTGMLSGNDTVIGTLIGGLAGMLAGPLGVLLGIGIGGSVGMLSDAKDIEHESGLLQAMTNRMKDGDVAIIAVVQESSENPLDVLFAKYDTVTLRFDASTVQEELEHAKEVQDELERNAREQMAEERSVKRREKVEEYKRRIRDDFHRLKERLQ